MPHVPHARLGLQHLNLGGPTCPIHSRVTLCSSSRGDGETRTRDIWVEVQLCTPLRVQPWTHGCLPLRGSQFPCLWKKELGRTLRPHQLIHSELTHLPCSPPLHPGATVLCGCGWGVVGEALLKIEEQRMGNHNNYCLRFLGSPGGASASLPAQAWGEIFDGALHLARRQNPAWLSPSVCNGGSEMAQLEPGTRRLIGSDSPASPPSLFCTRLGSSLFPRLAFLARLKLISHLSPSSKPCNH